MQTYGKCCKPDSVLESNQLHLLSSKQLGFRRNKSGSLQLLKCKNDWSHSLDKNIPVELIDFCIAFDTVSHQKLILKFENFGINCNLLSWISDFLSGRTQKVKVNDSLSTEKDVLSGVLQGT